MSKLYLVGAAFIGVLARVFQQKNVIGDHHVLIVITSYVIALGDVIIIWKVANEGLSAVPWVGTGGALGALSAVYLHRLVTRKGL